ncbi:porin family protein [Parapedobacter pyrenivorans]|uniref:porin family protein n=1 Tax=Parapedobacter pyrenivorans TaxID=1305674 RepID=UPI0033410A6F
MKNTLISFIFMFAILDAHAQRQEKIGFGIQAGWSMSRISGDTFDGKAGFIGGVHANFPVFGSFYVQPEVNFQQLGGKYKSDAYAIGDILYRDAELNMNYLSVPILMKYRFNPIDLDIFVGPQVGFKLRAKNKVGEGETYEAYHVKDTDIAGVYGLEYCLRLPDSRVDLILNARYTTGFTNFNKGENPNMPNDSYRNNALAFILGIRF